MDEGDNGLMEQPEGAVDLETYLDAPPREETTDAPEADEALYLKRRVFDVENVENEVGTQVQDEELTSLLAKLDEAVQYEANTQRQINAVLAGIEICLSGLNEGLEEAGYDGSVKRKEALEGLDFAESVVKTAAVSGRPTEHSDLFYVYDDTRRPPEQLEQYILEDEVLGDLKTELINMTYKVNELRLTLRAAKANCVKYRSKVAIRKTMLGSNE
ncbi:MAG: hypothetical protein LBR83_05580 [Clostridiales bacterium]|jgi:hypothetical protein|nr:hypothetical protein [Clostridiales bacterium]